ncbi:hypothetical protein [Aeromonas hydrophila]|uniref:hypothetical protein n=1 Tax=Aeromonas hydrophila TaxID=644 RepID=UPI002259A670|nr:hypothetical protein [Aeromonas hydrophila]MCX4117357.1 hypothetical protein [Aeromonas hydrophila]
MSTTPSSRSHIIANMYFSFLQESGLPRNEAYAEKLERLGVKPAVIEALENIAARKESYPLRRVNVIAAALRLVMQGRWQEIEWADLSEGETEIILAMVGADSPKE